MNNPSHLWILVMFDDQGRLCGRHMSDNEATARADAARWASISGQVATLNAVAVESGERFGHDCED